jgi:O-antigen/teichoic acid export membrane protein
MIVVFTGFADLLSDLGLSSALIQKTEVQQSHLSSVFWATVFLGLLFTVTLVGVSPFIADFYNQPSLRLLTAVIALSFFIGSFGLVHRVVLQRNMNFRLLAYVEITAAATAGVVALATALRGAGVWSLVIQSLMSTGLSAVLLWWASPWRPSMAFDANVLRQLYGFSLNFLGFNVFNYWVRNLDSLLIGRFVDSISLGFYNRAYSLMLLPVSQFSGPLSSVLFPALSMVQGDRERVKRIWLRCARVIGLLTFPVMMELLALAEPFILTLFGHQWRGVVPIFQVLCLSGMLQGVGSTVGLIYTSQGRTDLLFKWGIFAAFGYITAFVIGLQWGALGVASAYVTVGYLVLWYPGWTIAGRLIGLSFGEMVRNLIGPFLVATAMGAVIILAGLALPAYWPPWVRLAVQAPLGLLGYAALAHICRLRAYVELREIVAEQPWAQRLRMNPSPRPPAP